MRIVTTVVLTLALTAPVAAADAVRMDSELQLAQARTEREQRNVDSELVRAAEDNRFGGENVTKLLAAGANPNGKDKWGVRPLHAAARPKSLGNATVNLDALLAAGASPHGTDAKGNTPLHYAMGYPIPAIVKKLLAAGADPNAKNNDGASPLQFWGTSWIGGLANAEEDVRHKQSILALVNAGADPKVGGGTGDTTAVTPEQGRRQERHADHPRAARRGR